MKPSGDDQRLEDADPELAHLFSALRASGPSDDARARTVAAMAAAAAAPPAAPAPPTSPGAATASRAAWIGLGAALLALSVAGLEWGRDDDHAPRSTPTAAPAESAPPVRPTPIEGREPQAASVRVEDLPPATPAAPREVTAPKARPDTSTPKPAGDSFREELALVERARGELSRGDTPACLRTLDAYRAYVGPNGGVFTQEVEVMHVEALARSGDREGARARGGRFLADHPASPYAERVRSVPGVAE